MAHDRTGDKTLPLTHELLALMVGASCLRSFATDAFGASGKHVRNDLTLDVTGNRVER
jgi:hypothetical protein